MHWSDKYIGIPFVEGGRDFSGCDCGGLVLLVLREECGIEARDFVDYEVEDFKSLRGLIKIGRGIDEVVSEDWALFGGKLKPFDLLRFRAGKAHCHVGIYVGANSFMHVQDGAGQIALLASLDDLTWGPRLFEQCRHKELL